MDHDKWACAANKPGGDGYWLCDEPFTGIVQRPRSRSIVLDTPRFQGWWKPYYSLKDRTCVLLYMDTDSVLYLIETTTPEEDV